MKIILTKSEERNIKRTLKVVAVLGVSYALFSIGTLYGIHKAEESYKAECVKVEQERPQTQKIEYRIVNRLERKKIDVPAYRAYNK